MRWNDDGQHQTEDQMLLDGELENMPKHLIATIDEIEEQLRIVLPFARVLCAIEGAIKEMREGQEVLRQQLSRGRAITKLRTMVGNLSDEARDNLCACCPGIDFELGNLGISVWKRELKVAE
jgi:hypothetical protein